MTRRNMASKIRASFRAHAPIVRAMWSGTKLARFLPSKNHASLPVHHIGARDQGAAPCKIRASLPMWFKRVLRYLGDAQALSLISVLPQ